jgi:DNA polymerase epsilon subunit 2
MLVRLATNVTEQAVLSSSSASSSSSSSNHSWNHNSNQQQHQQQQDEAASVATTGRSIQPEWFLEDATSYVPLDLSSPDLIRASGFFTECSFALVEGIYVNGIFRVTAIAQPVAETRLSSIRSLASSDALAKSLGYDYHAPSSSSSSSMSGGMNAGAMDATQTQMMEAMQDARMMVLSDVHLDDASVMDRLEALFARLNDSDQVSMPQLCVMMGNFLSHAFGSRPNDHALFTTSFDALGQMLLRFPEVVSRMRFVFVPGPGDPSLGGAAVPRPPMPESFTKLFRESIPSAVFTTNPARIRFYGKEIVVFRQNLMSKMRRHAVLAPNLQETRDLSEHLIKTIIDQAHLSPLPMTAQPVYWELDRAMQLYPLPDMLVLGDTCTTYSWRYSECQAFNPGVFSMEAKFAMISPAGAGSVDIFQV